MMKAQVFLELVGVMLEVQQDYFKSRLKTDLVKAKELERRVWAVVKESHLEPDLPPPGPPPIGGGVMVLDENAEQQLRMELAEDFERNCMEAGDEEDHS
jgi:hypothetical protein